MVVIAGAGFGGVGVGVDFDPQPILPPHKATASNTKIVVLNPHFALVTRMLISASPSMFFINSATIPLAAERWLLYCQTKKAASFQVRKTAITVLTKPQYPCRFSAR